VPVTVTAALDGTARFSSDQTLALRIGEDGDSAVEGTDYASVDDASLSLTAADSSWQLTGLAITPTDDALDEGTETLTISGVLDGVTVNPATVAITDDEILGDYVIAGAPLQPDENGGTAQFKVKLSVEPTGQVDVALTAGDSALVTAVSPSTLSFDANDDDTDGAGKWSAEQTVTVTAGDDDRANLPALASTVTLVASGGGYDNLTRALPVTLVDDETLPGLALSASPASLSEGAASTEVTVSLALAGGAVFATDQVVAVDVSGAEGATEGVDFATVAPFDLTLPAGQSAATAKFQLAPVGDDLMEGAEKVVISGALAGAEVAPAAVTLEDDETGGLALSVAVVEMGEKGGTATFDVRPSARPGGPVTLLLTSDDETVATVTPDSLAFTATDWDVAQQVTVVGVDDDEFNVPARTTKIWINGAGSGYDDIANFVLATAADDEGAPGFRICLDKTGGACETEVSLAEGAGATSVELAILADEAFDADKELRVTVGNGGDSAGAADYDVDEASFVVKVPAGTTDLRKSVEITPVDDDLAENSETVSIRGVTDGVRVQGADVILADNDPHALTLSPSAGVDVDENATAAFTVALAAQPQGEVAVQLASNDAAVATVAPAKLVFAPADWDTPQSVTVTGVDDARVNHAGGQRRRSLGAGRDFRSRGAGAENQKAAKRRGGGGAS